ncbi:MAG: prevent-host-death family protein [Deltaproteobacteria bacterium CG03_land_8_20_14_0_80_45_14]|nr:MAG: prevent-host-death family protein [Deltaproteobacteria bacterium CG03_land_8_20_14_0_80_45_14]
MAKIPNIVPITDLRQDATSIIKRVTASREPLVITQRGRAAAVMVSMEAYEHFQHELELLRLLARGEKEIEAGKGYDLDAVLAEADSLLKEIKP